MRASLFSFFMLIQLYALAQNKQIVGRLVDQSTQKPIASASVMVKNNDQKIIAFKATDKEGNFSITTDKSLESCFLEINHLGYNKHKEVLTSKLTGLFIELKQKKIVLDDIHVKSRPQVRRLGDTLAYNVGSFAQEEDRSIGDVLKRMPGMEVTESGQIKYQGKAISNFYIDGDDLLDDRYNIGTRTIPHKMVQDIQVLNNHEHLKVLKNKRFSDQVAINLVIKEDAKLKMTGEAKIGAGLPEQYDSELNNILFNKKYKMLNVLNGNNTGKDLTGDLVGYNRENTLSRLGTSPINNLLSLGTVGAPPIAKPYYFMNNTAAINTNNLFNLANKWQLKSNVQALFDKNSQSFSGRTDYFTQDETISFIEQQRSEIKEWLAAIRLTASKNMDTKFISNALSFEYEKENGQATIESNNNPISVNRNHRISGISNKLEYVPQLKNGDVIQFNWIFNYGEKPQDLMIRPGVYASLLNQGQPYEETRQHVNVPNLFTRLTTGYRIPKGKINQYYGVGISLEDQRLSSDIALNIENGTLVVPQIDSTVNDLHWRRILYNITGEYSWKINRVEASLMLPVALQQTTFKDAGYALNNKENDLLFNPSFRLKQRIGMEDEMDFTYNYSNTFGNIQDIYRGTIIRSYRNISQNNASINESSSHSAGLNYRLSRTLKLLYAHGGINYSQTIRNALFSQVISNDISQTILVPIKNKVNSFQVSAGFDKYIFALASTVKLRASWSYSDFNQLFNGTLLPFQNTSFSVQPDAEIKLWKDLKLSYQSSLSWSTSKQKDNSTLNNNVFSASQNIGLPFYTIKRTYVRVSGRHLYSKQPGQQDINYFFIDAFARYRHVKWKTDFELNMSNLANIKTFNTYSISANQQNQNSYDLRGRMLVARVIFNL
ncbi:hypothetical protein SAMN05660862_2837 [Sphingobacterium psychroaquaticum]|uniref:CarboxypepD_reg-like domain-containing protein n=2 Tax=Sphingobacterium psychroaquaticum TaxID=561061 RepID=A0A1X7KG10_9SPHI|nr:hypothetical protein SAMN05660862_2837 [Sphingobacterium psychroaquaticum]